jgi:lipopolysaccharide export system permease protein
MLFQSSLRKELSRSFGGTFVVLITVVMTMMLIRTLGMASKGSVNPQDVMLIMGYSVIGHMSTILSLSLFISIVGTLSRMYRESEMAIWRASGLGLRAFIPPLLRFSWPILLLVGALSLLVWPWSNQKTQELRDLYEQRGDLERIAPGQFQESSNGQRVFFVEKDASEDKTGKNVFISAQDGHRQTITSARHGRIETIDGERFLILVAGQRLETSHEKSTLKISEFSEYGLRIGSSSAGLQPSLPPKSQSTLTLLRSPYGYDKGELAWRIGMAVAALNFVLLALAVAHANPRSGKSAHLPMSLLTFVAYFNLINLSRAWIDTGRFQLWPTLILLHVSIALLALAIICLRDAQWHWRHLRLPFKPGLDRPAA